MALFLANQNVPADAVQAARASGVAMTWIQEESPGANDDAVLALAVAGGRVLVTFDKDFGEMVFNLGRLASPGIVLLRPRLRSPDYLARFMVGVLTQAIDWEGNFCVAQEGRLRVIPLPE